LGNGGSIPLSNASGVGLGGGTFSAVSGAGGGGYGGNGGDGGYDPGDFIGTGGKSYSIDDDYSILRNFLRIF